MYIHRLFLLCCAHIFFSIIIISSFILERAASEIVALEYFEWEKDFRKVTYLRTQNGYESETWPFWFLSSTVEYVDDKWIPVFRLIYACLGLQ